MRIYTNVSSALTNAPLPAPIDEIIGLILSHPPSSANKTVAMAVIYHEGAGEDSSYDAPPHIRAHPIKAHVAITF